MMQTPSPTSAKFLFRRLDQFSPQLMDNVIESAQAEHLQLGKGAFNGDLLRVLSEGKVLDSGIYSQSILGRAGMPAGRVSLVLVLPARTGGILDGRSLDLPNPFLYTEGVELDCRLEPGTRWVCFQVPRGEIEACGLPVPGTYSGAVCCGSKQLERLTRGVLATLNELASSALANSDPMRSAHFAEECFDGLLAAFVSALSPEPSPPSVTASRSHRQLVRRAEECIDTHLADTLRIKDLCATSDVSYKTLERAFLAVLGVTPRRYLSLSRLARARRLLLEAKQETTRVTDVALACGYDELGRFSINYRQWFGEKPSHTLSRSA